MSDAEAESVGSAGHEGLAASLRRESNRNLEDYRQELDSVYSDLRVLGTSVAHDLRAPLHFVSMFASALREECGEDVPNEWAQYIDMICEGVEQLDQMVGGLANLLKVWGRPLERSVVRSREVVEELLAELDDTARLTDVTIEVGELPTCVADAFLLKQVFASLLDNALKFRREQAKTRIEVGYRDNDDGGAFYVSNTGIGLDIEKAEGLFKPYKRLQDAESFPGVGMGLAIARRIVERHGGHMWAEGTPSEVATFLFSLPLADLDLRLASAQK